MLDEPVSVSILSFVNSMFTIYKRHGASCIIMHCDSALLLHKLTKEGTNG